MRSSLVRGAGGILGLQILARGLGIVSGFILARSLGAAGLGALNYASALLSIFIILGTLGVPQLIVREITVAQVESQPNVARGLLSLGTIAPLIASLVIMAVVIFLSLPSIALLKIPSTADGEAIIENAWMVLALFMLLMPVQILISIRQAVMRAFGLVAQSRLPEYLVSPLLYVLMIGVGWFVWRSELPILGVVIFKIVAMVVAYLYGEHLLRAAIPQKIRQARPTYFPRIWFAGALPFMVISWMQIINNRADVIMLGMFDSLEGIGIYTVAAQFAIYVTFPLSAANASLAPRFASLYHQGKMEQLQQLFTRSARMVLLVTVGLGAAIILVGPFILGIYGSEFVAGRVTLNIIIMGHIVNVASGSVGHLLTMTNHSWVVAIGVASSAIMNITLNAFLIPRYGIEGAAIASAASVILWNIVLIVFAWRVVKIVPTAIGKFWK